MNFPLDYHRFLRLMCKLNWIFNRDNMDRALFINLVNQSSISLENLVKFFLQSLTLVMGAYCSINFFMPMPSSKKLSDLSLGKRSHGNELPDQTQMNNQTLCLLKAPLFVLNQA